MSIEDPRGGDRWHTGDGRLRKTHELDISAEERAELLKSDQKKQIQHTESQSQVVTDFPWMKGPSTGYDPTLDPKNYKKSEEE